MIATPAQASSKDMRLLVALFPDFCQVESEAGKLRIAGHRSGSIQTNKRLIGAINVDLPLWRIDEKAEFRAVRDVLAELELQLDQRFTRRPQLDYELRTDWSKDLLFFGLQSVPALAQGPGCIRRSRSAVRKLEPCV